MESEIQHVDGVQVLTPSALEAQVKAETDVAIATAKRYPRSLSSFLERAESLATINEKVAASMEYAKPVSGKKVIGPSARLAEIVAATYGNIRVQARVVEENDHQIVAQGIAHDLETNVAQSTEITVSILDKNGKRFKPDLVATVRAAACAKARRNATFLVVPVAICEPIIKASRKVAVGDQKTLPQRRKEMIDWFVENDIKKERVLKWLGKKKITDITLGDMSDLIAARNSAAEENVSLKDFFSDESIKSRFEESGADSMKMGNLEKDGE